MSLPEDYLKYPHRSHGMDHELYGWSNLFNRRPVTWPDDKSIALWITVALEYFPLTPNEGPFRAPSHMVTPYPDYRTYTTRDYGNRVGVFRIMKVLDALGLRASAPMSAKIAERYPALLKAVQVRDWEIIGHGVDMNNIHYGGMDADKEAQQIDDTLVMLEKFTGSKPAGWFSPARSESENTLKLLAEHGVSYVCDWVNDDMPYEMSTPSGPITAMPHTMELDDRQLMVALGQNEDTYQEQILAAFDLLRSEGKSYGGRILHLSLTPYVIGQPFRIHALKAVLEKIMATGDVWSATGSEILEVWRQRK